MGLLATLVCSFIVVIVNADSEGPDDPKVDDQLQLGVTVDQDDEASELVRILNDKKIRKLNPDRLLEAISKLGTMKYVQATEPLTKLLDFEVTSGSKTETGVARTVAWGPIYPSQRYPAIGALISIGAPTLNELVKVIEREDSGSIRSDNAIYTIRQISRDNPLVGVECLTQAKNHASLGSTNRKRLENAIVKLSQ